MYYLAMTLLGESMASLLEEITSGFVLLGCPADPYYPLSCGPKDDLKFVPISSELELIM